MILASLSSSSFFCLGIILVVIGVLGYLISRKFQEQNHKIATMCELVTTMAQDLQMLKMQNAVDKFQHTLQSQSGLSSTGGISVVGGAALSSEALTNTNRTVDIYLDDSGLHHKIVVSDDEDSFDDSESEDEEGSVPDNEREDDDDDDDDASTLEEFTEEVLDLEIAELTPDSDDDIEITEIEDSLLSPDEMVENVDLSIDEEERHHTQETKHIEILQPIVTSSAAIHTEPPSIVVNKLNAMDASVSVAVPLETEVVNELYDSFVSATETSESTPQPTATDGATPKPKKSKPSRTATTTSTGEEGDIENLNDFTGDYSKLNVTQLRNLVTSRGLSTHASKLKKTELLQLLGGGVGPASVELGEFVIDI